MCGVAAIYSYSSKSPLVDRNELRLIRDEMTVRGPDGFGEWFSENRKVALGHRRLSIIDLSNNASQPMQTDSGSLVISFNGEIYNYKELRLALVLKGYQFKTDSDTEVLLRLYEDSGIAMLSKLRGMFAFCLWDSSKNAMLIARDPYGIKPVYYADDGDTVRVASQVKALSRSKRVSKERDLAGIAGFYLFGSVPDPRTTFADIRPLSAGSYVWVNSQGISKESNYFSVSDIFFEAECNPLQLSFDEAQEGIRAAVQETIRHHFIADVPVGVFLSSGIDSSAIAAIALEAGHRDLHTLTLGFSEYSGTADDEVPLAKNVANFFKTRHSVHYLDQSEFKTGLGNLLKTMDQPSIDGINTYFVSKAASQCGWKVALSGLGGDEIFGGYSSFQDIPKIVNAMSGLGRIPLIGDLSYQLLDPISRRFSLNPKIKGVGTYGKSYEGAYLLKRGLFLPEELSEVMGKDAAEEGLKQLDALTLIGDEKSKHVTLPYSKIASLESSLYMKNQLLRDADWAGMAHSLEIRAPLVDSFFLKAVAPIIVSRPLIKGKGLLANSPRKSLPQEIKTRAKTGFTVPVNRWLESDNNLDAWKSIKTLKNTNCPWARRWAYTVINQSFEVS